MSNAYRNEVEYEVGGKKVTLRMTHSALREIEEARGVGVFELVNRVRTHSAFSEDLIEILYRCALAANGKDTPTYDAVAEEVLKQGLQDTLPTVIDLLTLVYKGVGEKKS